MRYINSHYITLHYVVSCMHQLLLKSVMAMTCLLGLRDSGVYCKQCQTRDWCQSVLCACRERALSLDRSPHGLCLSCQTNVY